MKRLDINLKILIAIIAFFGLSLSLMAQPRERHPQLEPKGQHGFTMMDLTEEQKTEIKKIHLAGMKDVQPLKDELKINKAKINALIKQDNPDMKEIVSLVEANGKLLTQIQVKRIEDRIQVRSLLTDEQKVIFDAHDGSFQKRRARAEHRPQRRHTYRNRF